MTHERCASPQEVLLHSVPVTTRAGSRCRHHQRREEHEQRSFRMRHQPLIRHEQKWSRDRQGCRLLVVIESCFGFVSDLFPLLLVVVCPLAGSFDGGTHQTTPALTVMFK